jgi:hypothetical protein
VKAYRALGRFRSGARFRPWLLAIVANEARNQRRAAARRAGLFLRAAREGTPENSPSSPNRRYWRRRDEKSCSRPWATFARRRGGPSPAASSWGSPKRRRPRSWVAREEPSDRGSRGLSGAGARRLRRREMPDRERELERAEGAWGPDLLPADAGRRVHSAQSARRRSQRPAPKIPDGLSGYAVGGGSGGVRAHRRRPYPLPKSARHGKRLVRGGGHPKRRWARRRCRLIRETVGGRRTRRRRLQEWHILCAGSTVLGGANQPA